MKKINAYAQSSGQAYVLYSTGSSKIMDLVSRHNVYGNSSTEAAFDMFTKSKVSVHSLKHLNVPYIPRPINIQTVHNFSPHSMKHFLEYLLLELC
jgi:hypothetical protein